MFTWSLEKAVGRLSDSVWSVVDVLGTVVYDACTLVPGLTTPRDPVDGAEALCDREAEEEVSEPRTYSIEDVFEMHRQVWDERPDPDELFDRMRAEANEYEPALTDDELVAVRGLIQERYDSPAASAGGPSEVDSGNPPATRPSEGHSPISFVDWASPAICTVLDKHFPVRHVDTGEFIYLCSDGQFGCGEGPWANRFEWLEHVAAKVADHLEMAIDKTNVFELNRVNNTPVK